MRKIYFFVLVLGCLFAGNKLQAQCSVNISTNTNTSQLNCTNTSITLTANAEGTLPITYLWDNNETEKSITVTKAGTYEVTITATGGCTTKSKITITQDIAAPSVSIRSFPEKICAGESANLVALGASTYVWQPLNSTEEVVTVNPLVTTTYTLTGKGLNGCTATKTFELEVNPLPEATIAGSASVCQNAPLPAIVFTGQSGTRPYTFSYRINNGATQTIQTTGSETTAGVAVPTGILGSFDYRLVAVTDANGCSQNQTGTATVIILPGPVLTSSKTASVCDSLSFKYTAESSATGTNFSWVRILPQGVTGRPASSGGSSPVINDLLHHTNSQPEVVKYAFSLSTGSGCVTTDTLFVTVSPTPVTNPVSEKFYCNGEFVNGGISFVSNSPGAVFSWTNNNTGIGLPASGKGNIPAFIALNPGGTATLKATITVMVKAGSDSCAGTPVTFAINVRPAPLLISPKAISICDTVSFSYTAESSANGTTFGWKRILPAGVTGMPGSATGNTANLVDRLDNLNALPEFVRYAYVLSTGSTCITYDTLNVIVNPTPFIEPVGNKVFCNGEFVASGIPFVSSSPGAVFRWTNSNVNIGLPASGSGSIPAFIATNTSGTTISATITIFIKASADSCTGRSETFSINVRPAPVLISDKTRTVCDNAPFNYLAVSSASATVFSWERPSVNGISNQPAAVNSATINERLNNTTDQPILVNYIFKLSTGSGCDTYDTLRVTVNPTPEIDNIPDTIFCNGTFASKGIIFTSSSPAAVFRWTNSNVNIGLPASDSGSIPAFIATNTGGTTITATITVFVEASPDGCAGDSKTFTITVRPAPVLNSAKALSVCDNSPFLYAATSTATGTSFSWVRPSVTDVGNTAGSAISASINETLDNTTDQPVIVNYIFTLSTGTGCVTIDTLKVTVNPTPVTDPVASKTYCNGEYITGGITFKSSSPGAVFAWVNSNTGIGLPASGEGNILPFNATGNATNTVSSTITVSVKASSDQCPGPLSTFTISVLPGLNLTSSKIAGVCDSSQFNYTATSSAAATTFNWLRLNSQGNSITPLPDNAFKNSETISETLKNNSAEPVVVDYLFRLSNGNNCVSFDTLKLTVYPTPEIDPIENFRFCNDLFVTGIPFTTNSSSSVLTWQNSNAKIGLPASGTGSIPSFIATNDTSSAEISNVRVSVSVNNGLCKGADQGFRITVFPTPTLTSAQRASVCNNLPFIYLASSSATGTSFRWERKEVAGISNAEASGNTFEINETLINTTSQPVSVEYIFTLSTGTNCITRETLEVTVNPTPRINPIADYTFCNGVSVLNGIPFTSSSPNSTFTWSNSNVNIGLPSSGTGSIPQFVATNTGDTIIKAVITVKVKASSDNCEGDSVSFVITVNPSAPRPTFTSGNGIRNGDSLVLCRGSDNINFNVSAPVRGISYTWEMVGGLSNNASIKDVNDANTVISFPSTGTGFVRVTATNTPNGGCFERVTQRVIVNSINGIEERKIFLKQPGNLLIYPDNSMNVYQWGFDSVISLTPNITFGQPTVLQNQVYQFLTPEQRFISGNLLDTAKYLYWVFLKDNAGCESRVYYNGPYAARSGRTIANESPVELLVFPNPNRGSFEIALKGNIYGNIQAKIYNATGQQVFMKDFVKMSPEIYEMFNTNQLSNGIYFLELYSSDLKKVVTRFIIQH